jgi:hypothetical protein
VEADRNKRPSTADIVDKLNGKRVQIFDQVWTIETSLQFHCVVLCIKKKIISWIITLWTSSNKVSQCLDLVSFSSPAMTLLYSPN